MMPRSLGSGRSMRNTAAPRSASSMAHIGPGPMPASSTTLIPASGPTIDPPFNAGASLRDPISRVKRSERRFQQIARVVFAPAVLLGRVCVMSGPLAGVRVVDLTSAVSGPVATQILGDMGADVIKVEPPQGDPIRPLGPSRHPRMGAYFLNINRNKKSVVLDLKQPAPCEALLKLVETADVFVHNMRLGAAERLGVDYPTLAGRNPRIVYAAATGFQKDGAHRDRPSFDDVIQGESGLAALNGGVGAPRYVPMAVCDKICGYVLASAVSMALFHRERTGEGQEVHVPMLETMVAFNLVDHLWHGVLAEPEKGLV